MRRLADFVVERPRWAWGMAWLIVLAAALGGAALLRELHERERLAALETSVQRTAVELMAQTLDGHVMGALNLLGLVNEEVKADARGDGPPNTPAILPTLESLGRAMGTQGVFVIGHNGVVRSSWDSSGKPSTGLDVRFRPYFRTALRGQENVYAAFSLARGDRALYFAGPIRAAGSRHDEVAGVVVARTDLAVVDGLLRFRSDIALLVSPQGVVFASSRPEWVGTLAGDSSPERLHAIREQKQFGSLFELRDPSPLPVALTPGRQEFDGRRYATAVAPVPWRDPAGDWQLVLLEDLSHGAWSDYLSIVIGSGALTLLLLTLFLKMLQGRYTQQVAADRLAVYAQAQAAGIEQKARLADAGLRFQQTASAAELAAAFLSEAHALVEALQGVVYGLDEEAAVLGCLGSYACAQPPAATLNLGDGLLGQCAADRQARVVVMPEDDSWVLHSGLGNTRPECLLLLPVLLQERLLGVVELAFLREPDRDRLALLEELVGRFALNLEIQRRNRQTAALLADSTESSQATAELAAFQQALIDALPYPVFFKGPDTCFRGFNRAYERAFAVNRDSLIGRRVMDLEYLPEADRLAFQAEDEGVVAQVGSVRREIRLTTADGVTRDVLYCVTGFLKPDGTTGGLVGTMVDISRVKRVAAEDSERSASAVAERDDDWYGVEWSI